MMTKWLAFAAVWGLAACSSPPPSSDPAPAVAAAPQAAPDPVSPVSPTAADSGKATTCVIHGVHWRRELQIAPTMAVSNDGYCGTTISVTGNTTAVTQVSAQPHHGSVDTFGQGTTLPGFRYHPDKGYVGPDSFVVVLGRAGHEVYANFSVAVSQ